MVRKFPPFRPGKEVLPLDVVYNFHDGFFRKIVVPFDLQTKFPDFFV